MSVPPSSHKGPGVWRPRTDTRGSSPQRKPRRLGLLVSDEMRRHPRLQRWIVNQFHRLYYEDAQQTWRNTFWRGVPVAKTPLDLWIYQELVHELKPDVVIETGTFNGGSALFFADLMELNGKGKVISIDLDTATEYPAHERITYLSGSSVDDQVLETVRAAVEGAQTVLIVLDSDHTEPHVSAEMDAYAPLVTPGSYLIVEDTNINGHPVLDGWGSGPMEAVEAFLERRADFVVDTSCEKFLMSFNAHGWLQRRSVLAGSTA